MIFDSVCTNIITILVVLITIYTAYVKWKYQYWKRRNVPFFEASFPFGSTSGPSKRTRNHGNQMKFFYDKIKEKGWKHAGMYSMLSPTLLVKDLDYIRNILTKDFQHFVDRGIYVNEKDDPLSAHLFNIGGQKWRNLRMKLSPTFTSGKMKMMFQALIDCVPNFLQKIDFDCQNHAPIDIKEILGCLTTDIIGSCAFGLECNSFQDENSPFRENGRKFFNDHKKRMAINLVCMNFPRIAKFLGLSMTSKDVTDFFINVVKDTVNYRQTNDFVRKDFLQLLIDLKNNKLENQPEGTTLTMEELAAQSFVFFVAGFETSSTTMTFAMYELARNPELQQQLRDEINTVLARHEGKVTYDAIQEMKFMDRIINETLRMYPPVPVLFRKCVKDYKLPDQDLVIQKGLKVSISVLGIHYDEEYYPEPNKFDPERFTEENKSKRHNYAHLPFGEGPRNCIGMRFGLMQSKVGLTFLIKNYKWSVNKKTIQPLKMSVHSFIPTAEGDIWLSAEKI